METATMGRVTVPTKIENLADVLLAKDGKLAPDAIRQMNVTDALIDTGASSVAMPRSMIEQLGLTYFGTKSARTPTGVKKFRVYGTAQVTIQDRDCRVDVSELPEGSPVLIGQIPLEIMDFVVDPKGQRLIGDPAHGGKWMMDMF
jgi:predicted aspartyl protease